MVHPKYSRFSIFKLRRDLFQSWFSLMNHPKIFCKRKAHPKKIQRGPALERIIFCSRSRVFHTPRTLPKIFPGFLIKKFPEQIFFTTKKFQKKSPLRLKKSREIPQLPRPKPAPEPPSPEPPLSEIRPSPIRARCRLRCTGFPERGPVRARIRILRPPV